MQLTINGRTSRSKPLTVKGDLYPASVYTEGTSGLKLLMSPVNDGKNGELAHGDVLLHMSADEAVDLALVILQQYRRVQRGAR